MMFRLLLIFIPFTSLFYALDQEVIKSYIDHHLPLSGTLQQTTDGFVYLDISDRYITECHQFIKNEGFKFPPYFDKNLVGAHITIMTPKEARSLKIKELGQTFDFKILDGAIVSPPKWEETKACILTIEAPEIDALRTHYGLAKSLYPLHITIGIKGNYQFSF